MRIAICLCIVGSALVTSAVCEVGGMFRRIPEVGEWASYEVSGQMTIYLDGKEVVEPGAQGMLTIKCVGEETIEDVRHLWIEVVKSCPELQRPGNPTVLKYLVAEDEVMSGIASCDFERGWFQLDGLGIEAFEREEPQFGPVWMNVLGMLPHVESPVAADDSKTITVGGKDVDLTQTESGQIADMHQGASDHFTGDCTFWPGDDLAFGVASVDQTWKISYEGEVRMEMQGTLNLVATGIDAVSELPDHN